LHFHDNRHSGCETRLQLEIKSLDLVRSGGKLSDVDYHAIAIFASYLAALGTR